MKPSFNLPLSAGFVRRMFAILTLTLGLVASAFAQSALVLQCPPHQTNWVCDGTFALVKYPMPTVSGGCAATPIVTCTPPSGSEFVLGTTTVTCVATNPGCRESASCSFLVMVAREVTPPVLAGPSNLVVSAWDPRGSVVNWPAPVLLCNGEPVPANVICRPPSGSLFPVGLTTVSVEATDAETNSFRGVFTVSVQYNTSRPGLGLDTDENGLNDIWEIVYNGQRLAPGDDTDGDGLTNEQESVAGTNPFDPSFRGGVRVAMGGGVLAGMADGSVRHLSVSVDTTLGKRYQLQFALTLGDLWRDFGPVHVGATGDGHFRESLFGNELNSPFLPTNTPQAFFRVAVSDVDDDQDGLTAWEESILGTSDRAADTGWGNDWISGGTGQDGTNATSGYGGAGIDVMIGNTGGDRQSALDWIAAHLGKPRLREVALAHAGHGKAGEDDPRFVVAAGTGGAFELSSWLLAPGTLKPHRLPNSEPPLAGWNVQLDVLESAQPAPPALNPFVVGRIGADSNLWLTLRRVDETGQQRELSTVAFKTNENIRVCDFAIAHQAIDDPNGGGDQFLLVTPVIGFKSTNSVDYSHPDLYLNIWIADVPTGRIIDLVVDPRNPAVHTNLPPKGARLQIVPEGDGRFLVSYLNRRAEVEYRYVTVRRTPVLEPGQSGFIVTFDRPVDPAPVVTPDFALGGLGTNSFTTLLPETNGTARLLAWNHAPVLATNRPVTWLGAGGIVTPPVNAFGVWRTSEFLTLSAVAYGSNTLRLDVWELLANGQASSVNHTTNTIDIITGAGPGGSPHVKVFDGSGPQPLGSQFDALTGRLENGQLRLDRWRVATEPGF